MENTLVIWDARSGRVYFGEHAKIMRLAFGIPFDVGSVDVRNLS